MNRQKRWALENPDKVRAQQERKRLRAKGLLPPYERPPAPDRTEDRKAYMREWHKKRLNRMETDPQYAEKIREQSRARAMTHWDKIKADPVKHAAHLEKQRMKKRAKVRERLGLDIDTPVLRRTPMPPEERRRRNVEAKRKAYRLKHGIPLDAPVGFRPIKEISNIRSIDKERAKRAAEVEAAKARAALVKKSQPTAPVSVDPPELQEFFRRSSKGEAPRPYRPSDRKRGAFWLRGYY